MSSDAAYQQVLEAFGAIAEETAAAARRLTELQADEPRRRGVHLLLLQVKCGSDTRSLADDTGLDVETAGGLLDAGRRGLTIQYGRSYFGPLHLSCMCSRLEERLGEIAPPKPRPLTPDPAWWLRYADLLLDAYRTKVTDEKDYGRASTPGPEMSLTATCARCHRRLWEWEHTSAPGLIMPEVAEEPTSGDVAYQQVLEAFGAIAEETAATARRLAELKADEPRRRGAHLLLLQTECGSDIRLLASRTGLDVQTIGDLLDAGRQGLTIHHGRNRSGALHLSCMCTLLRERLGEIAPPKPRPATPDPAAKRVEMMDPAWWSRYADLLLDAYNRTVTDGEDYGRTSTPGPEMSLTATCARCHRRLWEWEHTSTPGFAMPEVPAWLR